MCNDILEKLRRQIRALDPDNDDKLRDLRDKALAAAEAGRLDDAKVLVSRFIEARIPALMIAERLLLNTAGAEAALGWIAAVQDHPAEAAAHFRIASRSLPAREVEKRCEYMAAEADCRDHHGQAHGDLNALHQAVLLRKQLLLEKPHQQGASERIIQQNKLGNTLRILGEEEHNPSLLDEAAIAFRAALQDLPSDRSPLAWARVQSNLADALATAGAHHSGTRRLKEAVTAYRAALDKLPRERAPREWAGIQNNLGRTLYRLGERESSAVRLEEALLAFKAALKERKETAPLDRALTQCDLGDALLSLGTREGGTTRLREAIRVYTDALGVLKTERAAERADKVRSSLAKAERLLAARTS